MKKQRKKTTATITPRNQQKWKQQKQVEEEKDEEENDEERHIPDTLERQLEKLMDERENTPEITMGGQKKEGESETLNSITDHEADHEADKDKRD